MKKNNIGSSLSDFLEADVAKKRVIAWQLMQLMKEQGISVSEMARRMKTSRPAVDRLLKGSNDSVTLNTLNRAAKAVGRRLRVELV